MSTVKAHLTPQRHRSRGGTAVCRTYSIDAEHSTAGAGPGRWLHDPESWSLERTEYTNLLRKARGGVFNIAEGSIPAGKSETSFGNASAPLHAMGSEETRWKDLCLRPRETPARIPTESASPRLMHAILPLASRKLTASLNLVQGPHPGS